LKKTINKIILIHLKLYIIEYIGFFVPFILILMALEYIERNYLLILLGISTLCFEYRRKILKQISSEKNPYFFILVILSLFLTNYFFIKYFNITIISSDLWILSAPYIVLIFNEYIYYKKYKTSKMIK